MEFKSNKTFNQFYDIKHKFLILHHTTTFTPTPETPPNFMIIFDNNIIFFLLLNVNVETKKKLLHIYTLFFMEFIYSGCLKKHKLFCSFLYFMFYCLMPVPYICWYCVRMMNILLTYIAINCLWLDVS